MFSAFFSDVVRKKRCLAFFIFFSYLVYLVHANLESLVSFLWVLCDCIL